MKEENMCHAAFFEAVGRGNVETVKRMLQEDNPVAVDCRYQTKYCGLVHEMTAMCEASERGDIAMVQALLQAAHGNS